MKVDRSFVKSQREKKAWSQGHLSEVSGLGLRTIQRIEKTGLASYESAQALASVFAIDVADLRHAGMGSSTFGSVPTRNAVAGISVVLLVAVGSLFFVKASLADPIMLDVDASRTDSASSNQIREVGRLLIAEGKVAEMRIENALRLLVAPEIQDDGRILLTAQIFEYVADKYVLLGEPKLITANKKQAEIRITSDSGETFRFLITPHAN